MKLRLKLSRKINGWWDQGPEDTFDFTVQPEPWDVSDGKTQVGSLDANYWFLVNCRGDEKKVLQKARYHIERTMRLPAGVDYNFEILEGT